MAKQEEASKAAKIPYRPIGLTSSIPGGLLAGIVFKQVWRRSTPGDRSDPPTAIEDWVVWLKTMLGLRTKPPTRLMKEATKRRGRSLVSSE